MGARPPVAIANTDGSNLRQLASRPAPDNFKVPAWSPDGEVIACSAGSRDRYDFHNSVVAVRVEDGAQSLASPKEWGWTGWVEWLADGGEPVRLTDTDSERPAVSPDSRLVASFHRDASAGNELGSTKTTKTLPS